MITVLLSGLLNSAPEITIWIIAVVLSFVLLGRNGGMPARFLVIGSCSLFVIAVLSVGQSGLILYLHNERGLGPADMGKVLNGVNLFLGLIRLGGAILIFMGIWKKFNEKTGLITEQ